MKITTKLILMLCLILSGAFCYAGGVARTNEKGEGIPIEVKEKVLNGGLDKSGSIQASIDGHYLTIVFTESLGQVNVEIASVSGAPVEVIAMTTPVGRIFYIVQTGDYIVTFTLPNGDEYYGEFTVTD